MMRAFCLFIISLSIVMFAGCNQPHDINDGTCNPESNNATLASSTQVKVPYVDLGFKNKVNPEQRIGEIIPMAQPGQGGIGLGLYHPDGTMPEPGLIHTGYKTNLFFSVYHYHPLEISYKLIQFIDYIQTPIVVDGKSYENGFDFTMPPESILDIPLTFEIAEKGMHEVLLILAVSVKNKELDEEYRFKSGMEHIKSERIFLSVNDTSPSVPIIPYDTPPVLQRADILGGIFLNRDSNDLSTWFVDHAKPSSSIECYLHIGSVKNKTKKTYAVLLLNEWKQVEIYDKKRVLFLDMEPDMEAVFPVTLQMPAQNGVYDITPILIPLPYDAQFGEAAMSLGRTGIEVSAD